MRGINRVTLLGNLGKDPELKKLADGTPVTKITLATTETYRLKDGSSKTHTDWHHIILWRGLATLSGKYLKKGSLVYVEGRLKHRHYEDQEGKKKYVTEIIADELVMLDKKSGSSETGSFDEEITTEMPPF